MKIYVSNLSFSVQEEDLVKQFSPYGEVASVNIITDKLTKRSRGFAFVDMPDNTSAEKAIRELSGVSMEGRTIQVNEARPREERPAKRQFY